MRTLLTPRSPFAAPTLALLLALAASACRSPAPSRDAVAPLLGVVHDQERAWNAGSIEDFMAAGYWSSEDLTFLSGGDWTRGYATVLQRYRRRYGEEGRQMGRLSFTDLEALRLGAEVGLVRGRWKLTFADAEPLEGLMTLVMERRPESGGDRGGWRIVHDHTSLAPAPEANQD
jgi:beta-aspartyl-peptidase (threonine type)